MLYRLPLKRVSRVIFPSQVRIAIGKADSKRGCVEPPACAFAVFLIQPPCNRYSWIKVVHARVKQIRVDITIAHSLFTDLCSFTTCEVPPQGPRLKAQDQRKVTEHHIFNYLFPYYIYTLLVSQKLNTVIYKTRPKAGTVPSQKRHFMQTARAFNS